MTDKKPPYYEQLFGASVSEDDQQMILGSADVVAKDILAFHESGDNRNSCMGELLMLAAATQNLTTRMKAKAAKEMALVNELAEHYPIAISLRAILSGEHEVNAESDPGHAILWLRSFCDHHLNRSVDDQRTCLPLRIREGVPVLLRGMHLGDEHRLTHPGNRVVIADEQSAARARVRKVLADHDAMLDALDQDSTIDAIISAAWPRTREPSNG